MVDFTPHTSELRGQRVGTAVTPKPDVITDVVETPDTSLGDALGMLAQGLSTGTQLGSQFVQQKVATEIMENYPEEVQQAVKDAERFDKALKSGVPKQAVTVSKIKTRNEWLARFADSPQMQQVIYSAYSRAEASPWKKAYDQTQRQRQLEAKQALNVEKTLIDEANKLGIPVSVNGAPRPIEEISAEVGNMNRRISETANAIGRPMTAHERSEMAAGRLTDSAINIVSNTKLIAQSSVSSQILRIAEQLGTGQIDEVQAEEAHRALKMQVLAETQELGNHEMFKEAPGNRRYLRENSGEILKYIDDEWKAIFGSGDLSGEAAQDAKHRLEEERAFMESGLIRNSEDYRTYWQLKETGILSSMDKGSATYQGVVEKAMNAIKPGLSVYEMAVDQKRDVVNVTSNYVEYLTRKGIKEEDMKPGNAKIVRELLRNAGEIAPELADNLRNADALGSKLIPALAKSLEFMKDPETRGSVQRGLLTTSRNFLTLATSKFKNGYTLDSKGMIKFNPDKSSDPFTQKSLDIIARTESDKTNAVLSSIYDNVEDFSENNPYLPGGFVEAAIKPVKEPVKEPAKEPEVVTKEPAKEPEAVPEVVTEVTEVVTEEPEETVAEEPVEPVATPKAPTADVSAFTELLPYNLAQYVDNDTISRLIREAKGDPAELQNLVEGLSEIPGNVRDIMIREMVQKRRRFGKVRR